jgi:hypothetical protein
MPRQPTSTELRRFVGAAGGRDALIRLIDEALSEAKPRRGRERYRERYTIGTLERLAKAKPKDRVKIFEQLIDEGRIGGIGTKKSIAQRAGRNFHKGQSNSKPNSPRSEITSPLSPDSRIHFVH